MDDSEEYLLISTGNCTGAMIVSAWDGSLLYAYTPSISGVVDCDVYKFQGTTHYYIAPYFYVQFNHKDAENHCLSKIDTTDSSSTVYCTRLGDSSKKFDPDHSIFSAKYSTYIFMSMAG